MILLSVTSFIRIVRNKMSKAVDANLRKEQAGFRKGRACDDHIFTLRQMFEQNKEWQSNLFANFMYFDKAFDSVHRPALWNTRSDYGIPKKMVNMESPKRW